MRPQLSVRFCFPTRLSVKELPPQTAISVLAIKYFAARNGGQRPRKPLLGKALTKPCGLCGNMPMFRLLCF